jgi:hypothetical protein
MKLLPATIVVASLAAASIAAAHEWYPPLCCSGGDCRPIAASRVSVVSDGYMVDGKFHILASEARDSLDGRYHGCFPEPNRLVCFFRPPPNS